MSKSEKLDHELMFQLRRASFHTLLTVTGRILARLGYGDVLGMGRRSTRQKSWHGGFDLLAEREMGGETVMTLVKVLKDGLRKRVLSEMVGTLDLQRGDVGILVSPMPEAELYDLAKHYSRAHLVVWDGPFLSTWCRHFGIGVRGDGSIDYGFWSDLEESLAYVDGLTRIRMR